MTNIEASLDRTHTELTKWLEEEKANRRFWIVSLIVGILSLVVLLVTSAADGS